MNLTYGINEGSWPYFNEDKAKLFFNTIPQFFSSFPSEKIKKKEIEYALTNQESWGSLCVSGVKITYGTLGTAKVVSPGVIIPIGTSTISGGIIPEATVIYDEYFDNPAVDSLTVFTKPKEINNELKQIMIIASASEEDLEDSYIFNKAVIDFVNKYGPDAIDSIIKTKKLNLFSEDLFCSLLQVMGEVNNYWSYNDRLTLLLDYLNSNKSKLRYGAIIGLLNMNSIDSIPYLVDAQKKENIPFIRKTLQTAIDYISK